MNERLAERVGFYLPLSCNCAQSSFGALRDVFGFEDGGIFKAMTPFPGFGRGEICGAVSGCLMAFGLLYGNTEDDLKAGKKSPTAGECAREFCDRFAEHHSSLRCREILERRLGSAKAPEDQSAAAEWRSRWERECTNLVHDSVAIAAEIIGRHGKEQ